MAAAADEPTNLAHQVDEGTAGTVHSLVLVSLRTMKMHLAMGKGAGETVKTGMIQTRTVGIAATVPLGESDYLALIVH